ncbi:hypothetical protein E2C01_065273 [Portunus trituberculatus]|uniref:Uncharacterized protein n=1 Tax=Portunus trituberculatus TaxID=210409 RepID=A0A5B7HM35_PORTR|nr:hypothetical protein [Portunus trituberculatus]
MATTSPAIMLSGSVLSGRVSCLRDAPASYIASTEHTVIRLLYSCAVTLLRPRIRACPGCYYGFFLGLMQRKGLWRSEDKWPESLLI